MCIGYIILYLFCFLLNTIYISKITNIKLGCYVVDILPSLIVSILMCVLIMVSISFITSHFVAIVIGMIIGVVFYYTISRIWLKEDLQKAFSLLKNKSI